MAFVSRNLMVDLFLTALAPAIWGSTYIVTSQFLPPDRPFIAALLRVLPAGIALLIWSRRFPLRAEWWKLIVTGILNIGAFQALLFIAAYRLPGGLAAVIGAIQPLLVMLLAGASIVSDRLAGGALGIDGDRGNGDAAAVAANHARTAGDRRGVSGGDEHGAGNLAVASLGDRFTGYRADRLAAADWRYRTGTNCVTGRSAAASGDADSGGGLSVAVRCRGDAGIRPVVSRYQPPFPGGGVGDEPAESGDGGAIRLGFPRAKIEGMALVGLVIVLFSVLSIQRALSKKSAVAGR